MAHRACLFAVQIGPGINREVVERRIDRLTAFYQPLGVTPSIRLAEGLRLCFGAIRFDGKEADLDAPLIWGPLPLPGVDLLRAGDSALRRIDTPTAVIAVNEHEGVIVAGAGGITTLYSAETSECAVWSTHVVAAAVLAGIEPCVDRGSIPEFLATEFVGGDHTFISGVRAVEPATKVTISADGHAVASFWPPAERWTAVAEREAHRHVESNLIESLRRQLGDQPHPVCGLSAGLDSRVVAIALRESGIPFAGLTWGAPDSEESRGARRVAETLGVEHRCVDAHWLGDDELIPALHAEARWTDGMFQMPFARPEPAMPNISSFVTGAGGETGRCFYYRWVARNYRDPSPRALRRIFTLRGRIADASPDALSLLGERVDSWLSSAEDLGVSGWRTLDVVYAEQRMRRWGRAGIPRGGAGYLPAFMTPEVQRGLMSLPLEARLTDDFHRRFIQERVPALTPPRSPYQRQGVPPLARRAIARLRGHGARRQGNASEPNGLMAKLPETRAWIAEEVFGSPVIVEPMGREWCDTTRGRFLAGDSQAIELAKWAAAPVALDKTLVELRRDG